MSDRAPFHSNSLKCRFCNWSTPKAYTTKGGQFRGVDAAASRLLDHVAESHPAESDRIDAWLDSRE